MPMIFAPVMFIIAFPLVIIGGLFLIWALKICKGGKDKGLNDDETRMIQEIYQGLTRMEDRVAALETILLDSERESKVK